MLNVRKMDWKSGLQTGAYSARERMKNRMVLLLALALALAGILGACKELGPDRSGGMSARLIRGSSQPTNSLTLDPSITTLRATVSASDMEDVTTDFSVATTDGVVQNIPAGSNRTLVVRGLDASENIIMEGITCGITVSSGQTADAGAVIMNTYTAPNASLDGLTGVVAGVVVDATDASLLSGVSVHVCKTGTVTTTDASGVFTFSLVPAGAQTLSFTLSGYIKANRSLDVGANSSTSAGIVPLSRSLSGDQTRMVLTWGQSPSDLDFHTLTPGGEHIYFANPSGQGITLDVDDVSAFGPETITISERQAGTYTVFVHNFSGSSSTALSDSGANVEVYGSVGLVQSVDVAGGSSTLDYWNVLTLTDGQVTVVNTFSSAAP